MSDCRAAGFVAGASPTGIETRPKLRDPFQVTRIRVLPQCRRTTSLLPPRAVPSARLHSVAVERTIPRLWQDAISRWPAGDTAYLTRHDDGWRAITWEEAAATVSARANGFLARGVRKGEAYAILARTTLDWALTDFALAHIGAVTAPIYATSSPHDVAYVLEHSEAVGIVCEDADQLAKVEQARAGLPHLRE